MSSFGAAVAHRDRLANPLGSRANLELTAYPLQRRSSSAPALHCGRGERPLVNLSARGRAAFWGVPAEAFLRPTPTLCGSTRRAAAQRGRSAGGEKERRSHHFAGTSEHFWQAGALRVGGAGRFAFGSNQALRNNLDTEGLALVLNVQRRGFLTELT